MAPTIPVDVLIRYKESEKSLPHVLACLKNQDHSPARIIGVDTGSTDSSTQLLREAGAEIVRWDKPYNHPKVLNFGISHCVSDFILVLSSHTALLESDTLVRLYRAVSDPAVACASGVWDEDPFFGEMVDWQKLKDRGMKFGSIYSNSMGMLRRSCWENFAFDEDLKGSEDYAWAVEQLRRGHQCRRLSFPFDYQRSRNDRVYEMSLEAFQLAKSQGLKLVWLGPRLTLQALAASIFAGDARARQEHWGKFRAWLHSR